MNATALAIESQLKAMSGRGGRARAQDGLEQLYQIEEQKRELLERKYDKKGWLNGIDDPKTRRDIAVLYENQARYGRAYGMAAVQDFPVMEGLQMEDFTTADFATYDKFAFPIIRALFPQLAATDLVSVQPMSGPTSLVFFLDYVYGSTKGSVTAGTKLFENPNAHYSSANIDAEQIGTGDGATTNFVATLAWLPVRPGTVTVTAGAVSEGDDGDGAFPTTGPLSAGTINYETGAINVTFDTAPANGVAVTVEYEYELEMQDNIPQVDIVLSKSPIVADERKLRTRWSFEAQQDMKSVFGLDAEVELTAEVTTELRFEIDLELVRTMWDAAFAPTSAELPFWNKNPDPGVSWAEHKSSFKSVLIAGSSIVNRLTARANPNWLVGGYEVTDVIEDQPDFVPEPGASFQGRGIRKIGTWKRWAIYLNPAMDQLPGGSRKHYLLGYKGGTFFDSGFVYAPYVPLYATPTVSLDDFKVRKGIASRYATKLINGNFYLKSRIVEQ